MRGWFQVKEMLEVLKLADEVFILDSWGTHTFVMACVLIDSNY